MISFKTAKIVYFKKIKGFASHTGEITGLMDEAVLYDIDMDDRVIISFFDDEYQDQIEVWKVEITIRTVLDLNE